MPPPNITGKLHMGHALFLTIQDGLTRFWKNQGNETLWAPGLDHAGLATHDKILKYQKKSRMSYEDSSKHIESTHREIILNQITKLGALPDWDLLTYTLDKEYESFACNILKICFDQGRISAEDGQIYLDISDLAQQLYSDLHENKFNIVPSYEMKNLLPFLNNIEKWNISRQIPWGTKLPFRINEDGKLFFDPNGNLGSLDTWFNSSLWPLASLLKNPSLIEKFYPATLIETGADILFFWCARMLMMSSFIYKNQKELGLSIKDKYAFNTIYLHGIIRDKNGDKFSKSLGNGIDPLDMINKYGADATRLFIISRTGPSEDIIFNEDELITFKKFINKIWNSAKFFSIYAELAQMEKLKNNQFIKLSDEDSQSLKEIQEKFCFLMNEFKFLEASRFIHSKYKEFFCDYWIEKNKGDIQNLNTDKIYQGIYILDQMLAMIDPFCPYISFDIKNRLFDMC